MLFKRSLVWASGHHTMQPRSLLQQTEPKIRPHPNVVTCRDTETLCSKWHALFPSSLRALAALAMNPLCGQLRLSPTHPHPGGCTVRRTYAALGRASIGESKCSQELLQTELKTGPDPKAILVLVFLPSSLDFFRFL